MLAFAAFARAEGVNSLGQAGKAHVIRYWKLHRHLSDATLYNHWRAISILWQLAEKKGEPPRPRLVSISKPKSDISEEPAASNILNDSLGAIVDDTTIASGAPLLPMHP